MGSRLRQRHRPLKPVKVASAEFCLAEMLLIQKSIKATIDARLKGHKKLSPSLKMVMLADAIINEGSELKAWLPWKLWRGDYGRELTEGEREGVIEELVDLLHFVLEGFIDMGIDDPKLLTGYYLAKAKINKERQQNGY